MSSRRLGGRGGRGHRARAVIHAGHGPGSGRAGASREGEHGGQGEGGCSRESGLHHFSSSFACPWGGGVVRGRRGGECLRDAGVVAASVERRRAGGARRRRRRWSTATSGSPDRHRQHEPDRCEHAGATASRHRVEYPPPTTGVCVISVGGTRQVDRGQDGAGVVVRQDHTGGGDSHVPTPPTPRAPSRRHTTHAHHPSPLHSPRPPTAGPRDRRRRRRPARTAGRPTALAPAAPSTHPSPRATARWHASALVSERRRATAPSHHDVQDRDHPHRALVASPTPVSSSSVRPPTSTTLPSTRARTPSGERGASRAAP